MEKRTYYLTIGSGTILADKEYLPNFDFEIRATDDELNKLEELFEDTAEAETRNAHFALTPYMGDDHDADNELYDKNLKEVYRMIHALGTPKTRSHIESMNVL